MALIQSQKFKQRKSMKQEQAEELFLQSNQSFEFEYLTNHIYEQLLMTHQKAKKFVQELGPLRDSPVLDCLAIHCKEIKLGFITSDFFMDLMEARLNKIIKNNKLKKNWSAEDLKILIWLISKYIEKNGLQSHQAMTKQDWKNISSLVVGSSAKSCMFKFISLKKFKLAHHKWQKDEENLLFEIIQQVGTTNWKLISELLYEQNSRKSIFRTPKQCRQHWSCYLDPKIKKGPWQRDQDRKLLQAVLDNNCQKKWSAIKPYFQGRTENALKNRYNLLLQKREKLSSEFSQEQLLLEILKEDSAGLKGETKESEGQTGRVASFPIPVIPKERRNMTVAFRPGIFIFFNQGEYQFSSL